MGDSSGIGVSADLALSGLGVDESHPGVGVCLVVLWSFWGVVNICCVLAVETFSGAFLPTLYKLSLC